uniref:Small fragment nuclease n=1 Tax=Neogobius melanostomus TaxID=47308 RepID=A0A8C6S423_9GOBI
MPVVFCSRTPTWAAAVSFLSRRAPQLIPRAAPSPLRPRCCSTLRNINPAVRRSLTPRADFLPFECSLSVRKMSTNTSSSIVSSSAAGMSQRMVWVDLEMTGLDIEKDQIIEMACLITDSDMNVLAEGPNLIIKQPDELLDSMSDWCKEHHGEVTRFTQTSASWTSSCPSSCTTSTTGSSTSAPSRSSAGDGSQKNTRRHLRKEHLTGLWTTSRRALRSCSFTEPTSSNPPQTRRNARSWRMETEVLPVIKM